ncbi:MAG: tRNA epoxyqueuosine(34) reductase QueG [Prevotellaceae bacterium]|jgi:epoxyqueuosine reductase|nr:tRNA epoxyqueuosine(34) reductase QueG [Prevotellaceae bacterium]
MDAVGFTDLLKKKALSLGFDACGAAQAGVLPAESAHLQQWLATGIPERLAYMARNVEKRCDVRLLVEGAQSVFMLLMNYKPATVQRADLPQVAYYAYGEDYHTVIRRKLNVLEETVKAYYPNAQVRGFVDTAPLLEKAWAVKAGLGWIGKNSLLVSPAFGSFVFLAALVTDVELTYDKPLESRCGHCTLCVDACPNSALEAPYRLNVRKCISYQTIEDKALEVGYTHRYILGCDSCQLPCPWNKATAAHVHEDFKPFPELLSYTAKDWLALDDTQFNSLFAHSCLQRSGLKKIQKIIR